MKQEVQFFFSHFGGGLSAVMLYLEDIAIIDDIIITDITYNACFCHLQYGKNVLKHSQVCMMHIKMNLKDGI